MFPVRPHMMLIARVVFPEPLLSAPVPSLDWDSGGSGRGGRVVSVVVVVILRWVECK